MIFKEIVEICFVVLMIIFGLVVVILDMIDIFSRDVEDKAEPDEKVYGADEKSSDMEAKKDISDLMFESD